MSIIFGILGAIYGFFGIFTWLNTALEMMGDTSQNSYLKTLREFSRKNTAGEVVSFSYLVLFWPIHWLLRLFYRTA
jgi:hypothetical protein